MTPRYVQNLALTDDYAMSALTVAIWGKPDQICSMGDFLRMTPTRSAVQPNTCAGSGLRPFQSAIVSPFRCLGLDT
jgi:hypothetical protein